MRVGGNARVCVESTGGLIGNDGGAKGGQLEKEEEVDDGMQEEEGGGEEQLRSEAYRKGREGGKRTSGREFVFSS